MKSNRFVVYTAIFGGYDELLEPSCSLDNCDFICFTDQANLKSKVWDIRYINDKDLPNNMMNRKFKLLPHLYLREYEYSLYIDANIQLVGNPYGLAEKYLKYHNFLTPKHFYRDCVFEEAKECVALGRVGFRKVKKQMKKYRMNGVCDEECKSLFDQLLSLLCKSKEAA